MMRLPIQISRKRFHQGGEQGERFMKNVNPRSSKVTKESKNFEATIEEMKFRLSTELNFK